MGTQGLTGSQPAAFNADIYKNGLDLGRFKGEFLPGFWKVASSATTIRPGQIVSLNASNEIILSTGANTLGVARWKKFSVGQAVNVDEAIVLTGTTVVNLKRANVSNVQVRSAVSLGGTQYTGGGTDYTANTTNGTIQRVALGAITDGQTVYVTYTFALTAADYQLLGTNFFNTNDDVTLQDNRLTVIQGPALIWTTEYDTSRSYTMTGAGSSLFCNASSQFTNVNANEFVGKVIQIPQASDPFLGIRMTSSPVQI